MMLEACSSLAAVLVLIRHTLRVLGCCISLWEDVTCTSHLRIWSRIGSTSEPTLTILRNVKHALWLHVLVNGRDLGGGSLWWNSIVILLEARLLFVANDHLLLDLLILEVLGTHNMLGSGGATDWATNRVALVIAWSLAIVTLFFYNILLVWLPIFTIHLLLDLVTLTSLICSIIKPSQLLLRLVAS